MGYDLNLVVDRLRTILPRLRTGKSVEKLGIHNLCNSEPWYAHMG